MLSDVQLPLYTRLLMLFTTDLLAELPFCRDKVVCSRKLSLLQEVVIHILNCSPLNLGCSIVHFLVTST